MTYVKHINGFTTYPCSLEQLRSDNPNVDFPNVISDEFLASLGVYPVTMVPIPNYDSAVQVATLDLVPVETNGVWTLGWTVQDKISYEIPVEQAVKLALRIIELKRVLAETNYDKTNSDILAQRQAWSNEVDQWDSHLIK